MASLSVTIYREERPSSTLWCRAYATVTFNYSTATPTNPPTTVQVTASSVVVSAVHYAGNSSEPLRRATKAQLETALSSATATLTFGGQTVASRTGLTLGYSYAISGTKSVNRSTSATTATVKETCAGGSSSASVSVPALPSWAVTYDGNSGTAVPNAQTKYYGINRTLSGNRPNKADHTFLGWATSTTIASTGTVEYTPSQTYTANAGLNLYAVWERNYQKPIIDNLHVDRCRQDGTLDDDGTYAKVTFDWSVFRTNDPLYYGGSDTPYSANAVDGCTVQVGTQTVTPTLTGASGTYSAIVGNGSYDVDTSYPVSVSITDTQAVKEDKTTTVEGLLSMAQFPMDINANATAIGFFRPAPDAPEEGAFFAKNVDAPTYSVNGTALIDFFYPVGSYYETSDTSFNPNDVWGGTWVEDTAGRVLVSAGTNAGVTYSTGGTGGNKDAIVPYHRHGVASFNFSGGSHSHSLDGTASSVASGSNYTRPRGAGTATANQYVTTSTTHTHTLPAHNTDYAGTNGNATNANMQPYIVVKRWHRTA